MKKSLVTILIIILLISMVVFGFACKKEVPIEVSVEETPEEIPDDDVIEQPEEDTEEEPIEETPEKEAADETTQKVNYNIKFEATWSSDSHPDSYVSSAHFSPFVVYSYNGTDQGRIFIADSISTPGIKEMAETGATGMLIEEINQIIEANNALSYARAVKIDSPGQTEVVLNFTQEFSHFIFVSMIAPSPDWFVAGESSLFIEGQWIDKMILDVISFDAGTDSGDSLTAANYNTNPKQPISRFDESLQKLGNITITKI